MRKKGKFPKIDRTKLPKKKNFLDDYIAKSKKVPAANHYKEADPHVWVTKADIEKGKKRPKDTRRNTYIE